MTQTYVRVANGVVAEAAIELPDDLPATALFPATMKWVNVTGQAVTPTPGILATEAAGVWSFAAPPPPPANLAAADSVAVAVLAAVAAGCPVVSTGTPALSGTYAIDAQSTANFNAVSTYITVNGKFPAGQTTLPWPDASGVIRTFGSTGQFQAFASALADWVMKISLYQMGQAPALPTGAETIP